MLGADIMKEVKRYDDGNGCTRRELVDAILILVSQQSKPVSAPSDTARLAAEEIASWYEDDTLQRPSVEEVAAIISKHFAATSADNDAEGDR